MRQKKCTPRVGLSPPQTPSPSSVSSGSLSNGDICTPLTHRISPSDFSTVSPLMTPPDAAVRRLLSYSPTKRSLFRYRRISVILVGCIVTCVFVTMLCTFLLIGETAPFEPDRGLTFGTPEYHPHLASRRIGGQPRKWSRKPAPMDTITNVTSLQADQKGKPNEKGRTVSTGTDQKNTIGLDNLSGQEKIASRLEGIEANEVSLELKHEQDVHPRLFYLEPNNPSLLNTDRVLEDDPMLHAPPGFEAAPQDRLKTDYTDGDCVPMHEWQTKSFPNCNLVHEYDLTSAGPGVHRNNTNLILEDNLVMLGQGWFRNTWRLDVGSTNEKVVLKTLRLEREFYDEFYDLHRRDALAMERLTHSPFIMDIYGYCGQSALNELADFGDGNLASLEKVDRQLRGTRDPASFLLKLQLATSVAVGVAHIHEIDKDGRPSLVHYDLNPRNVAIVGNGKPKINDFNIAEFLHWNPKTNETCGFAGRLHEPWWRAPEEVAVDSEEDGQLLDEKVDVYALGSILFHVLTTHSPRGKMKKDRIEEVREKVARGEAPFLEEQYAKSKDPAVKAFRRALDLCFEPDPKDRGSAREVADLLLEALVDIKKKRKAQDARKKGKHSRRLAEISSYEARATYIRNESHRVFKGSSKQ